MASKELEEIKKEQAEIRDIIQRALSKAYEVANKIIDESGYDLAIKFKMQAFEYLEGDWSLARTYEVSDVILNNLSELEAKGKL